MAHYDYIIRRGLVFDGLNNPAVQADVAIKNNIVQKISCEPLDITLANNVIEADGKWVTPGFIDLHTHYDAEVLVAPSLQESVRHGITTCFIGSCSISMVYSEAEDASDIFTRVESIPREYVLPTLKKIKTWSNAKEYVEFLKTHPLGPNISSYVGHSDLRVATMGLGRAVDPKVKPTDQEMQRMEDELHAALDAGFLGMSTMTNPWDKVDGDRYRSSALPSVYARWKEYRRLHKLLRSRNSILQSAPNLNTKFNAVFFLFTSASLWMRKKLRTTLITMVDTKADPYLASIAELSGNLFNKFFGADFRWQALPTPFEVYADGIDFIIFEEFPAGEMALHLQEDLQRKELFEDDNYREQFKKQYRKRWGGKVWHRDFSDAHIIDCPDASLIGKDIAQVAKEKGKHEVDTFLDLIIDYGKKLRWRTLLANHRPDQLKKNITADCALIGFSDAGAHIRNMAFYNFPLFVLKLALDDADVITPERAIHRVTGEIANWYGIQAGTLREGDRADITIIDPAELKTAKLNNYHEAPFEELGGMMRIVNRNPNVVNAVFINGQLAFKDEQISELLGHQLGFGQFLPAYLANNNS